jgi:cell division protein FtsZ
MITLGSSERLVAPSAAVAAVKVIGLGNAGLAVLRGLLGEAGAPTDLVAMHTDAKAVGASAAPRKLQIGREVAKGLGAGGDAARGRASASESLTEIRAECGGAELVILCAGLGGGTGSGAAPVVAEQAKKAGALVVAIVALPFAAEGSKKRELADESLARLARHCLTVLCFENDRLVEIVPSEASVSDAFGTAAAQLSLAVRAVTQMVGLPAVWPVGLDELQQVFQGADARCHFGYGVASGPDRMRLAVDEALRSPLLEQGKLLSEPGNVLLHLTGDQNLGLAEMQFALRHLAPHLGPSTKVQVGVAVDAEAGEAIGVAIMACTHSGVPALLPDDEEEFAATSDGPAEEMAEAIAAGGEGPNGGKPAKAAAKRGKGGKKPETGQMQEELPLDQAMRGRFKGLDPTMVDGQDLDIPAFIRMRIRLK